MARSNSVVPVHPPSTAPPGGDGVRAGGGAGPVPGDATEHGDPVISLIVPVHNGAQHLPRFLSCLDRELHPSFEVIFVDDGSTDATPDLLEAYRTATTGSAVHVVTLTTNQGAGEARRAGLAPARGRYLMWLDIDDEPVPGAFATALVNTTDADLGSVVVFDYRYHWKSGRSVHKDGMAASHHDGLVPAVRALLRRDISPYMWNKLVPRHGLRSEHFATRRNGQDWLTLVNILSVHPRVRHVPAVLVDYVQQPGTLSRSTNLVDYSSPTDGLVAQMRALLDHHHLWTDCQREFALWFAPRIGANTALASARRDDPGPDDTLPEVAAQLRRQLSSRQLLRALTSGDRTAAAALCLLRLAPRQFRRVARTLR